MTNFKIDLQANKRSTDGTIMDKVNTFGHHFKQHEQLGYNFYKKPATLTICDRKVDIEDRFNGSTRSMLMFGSNSYLGASANKEAIQKSISVTKDMGIGSGGVPLLSGTTIYQNRLEQIIAELKGFDDSIVFSSGFAANIGVLVGLIRPNNLIIHDRLNHASIIDGSIMTGAKMVRYKHNDVESLDKILNENYSKYKDGMLVITDGVFSMDGDIANIPEILRVVRKYNALLVIDDAHSTGVIGAKGAGTLSHFNISNTENIIVTGTLSKAIGTVGGFITANQKTIDYLRIFARSNMYSTSLPPSVCASAIEVIKYMKESDVTERLKYNYTYLSKRLMKLGFNVLKTATAIIPVVVGNEYQLTKMSKDFYDKNIFLNYIFPPVVSPKLSRLRISVMANHTKEDLDYLIDSISQIGIKYQIIQNQESHEYI